MDDLVVNAAVVAALPGEPVAWLVHAVRAVDPKATQAGIARQFGVNRNTIHRAVDILVGIEDVLQNEARSKAAPRSESQHPSRARDPLPETRDNNNDPLAPDGATAAFEGLDPPVDVRQLLKEAAHAVAAEVWKMKNPRPATPFIAVQKIAARFLDAGHDHDAIVAAMVAVPTISIGWVEARLNGGNQRHGKESPQDLQARIDEEFNLGGNR